MLATRYHRRGGPSAGLSDMNRLANRKPVLHGYSGLPPRPQAQPPRWRGVLVWMALITLAIVFGWVSALRLFGR